MTDMFRLDGKVAVVVGGGGGIGRALALGLARQGATVALASRAEEDKRRLLQLFSPHANPLS